MIIFVIAAVGEAMQSGTAVSSNDAMDILPSAMEHLTTADSTCIIHILSNRAVVYKFSTIFILYAADRL
jgi:hypothetical protein